VETWVRGSREISTKSMWLKKGMPPEGPCHMLAAARGIAVKAKPNHIT